MQATTIFTLFIAAFVSLFISWYLYYYKSTVRNKTILTLFLLRSFGVFLIFLLFINPTITKTQRINKKPILSILIDNSKSIHYFKKENDVKKIVQQFQKNTALNNQFELQYFKFGNELATLDSLTFNAPQTNINKALNDVEELYKNKKYPVVLISDGNQTTGNPYEFIKTVKNVFPIIIGDTTIQKDLRVAQINVNKYSYLHNKFPVEVRVLYQGNKSVIKTIRLHYKGKVIFKKTLSFSKKKNVQTVRTTIQSTQKGAQQYTVSIDRLKNEKNTQNNVQSFSVQVLNEQTKILLLTDLFHPDIGALKKAITTNKQRSVTIKNIAKDSFQVQDYQLVILYQPNEKFESVFKAIRQNKTHNFILTGPQTNWNFLNEVQPNFYKNSIQKTEEYTATFNPSFLTFNQQNINFQSFPPLIDLFGSLTFNTKHQALLYQNISGVSTQTPLLATFENGDQKSAVLFGSGIWKWRAASFINSGNFQNFDQFLGNLVQYLAATKKRTRLTIDYKSNYLENLPIEISAFYVDKNYRFDARANLLLTLENKQTKIKQNIPFSLQNNSFKAVLNDLPAGDYNFTVRVKDETVQQSGNFKITPFQIENQFTKANTKDLFALALKTNGTTYYDSNTNQLITNLLADKRYAVIQKTAITKETLMQWQLILFTIIALFTVEWFIRKYNGKI